MPAKMQLIREYTASAGQSLTLDRTAGIIRGVKILGPVSENHREYPDTAMLGAMKLYEGAKVNVNHTREPNEPRGYEDRIGLIRGVTFRPGGGLFADFHFNPKHPLAEQLMWDAEHAPGNVGFSHDVEAKATRKADGRLLVEEIVRVQSVDLVADPATTRGLFESKGNSVSEKPKKTVKQIVEAHKETPEGKLLVKLFEADGMDAMAAAEMPAEADDGIKAAFRQAIVAAFDDDKLDMQGTLAKMREILKAYERLQGGGEQKKEGPPSEATEALRRELAAIKADVAVRDLCEAAGVKADGVRRKALLALTEEADRKALLETWANGKGGGQKPVSREQGAVPSGGGGQQVATTEQFIEAICE